MKNNKNTPSATSNNHRANPSRIKPEVAAMQSKKATPDKSKPHDLVNSDKREEARVIHTNGSTPSDRL